MGYLYTISIWTEPERIIIWPTDKRETEIRTLWSLTSLDEPWLHLDEKRAIDTVEQVSNRRVYLTESQARGDAERALRKRLQYAKRAARAEHGKARKKVQYNITRRRGRCAS